MASKKLATPERREGLIVQKLGDEAIVYDPVSHRAHSLNRTAALVFEKLDGKKNLDGIARDLSKALGPAPHKEIVAVAMNDLAAADLLTPGAVLPRRSMLRGLAASLIPVIATIAVPSAAAAASCSSLYGPCTYGGGECCYGLTCVQVGTSTFECV